MVYVLLVDWSTLQLRKVVTTLSFEFWWWATPLTLSRMECWNLDGGNDDEFYGLSHDCDELGDHFLQEIREDVPS